MDNHIVRVVILPNPTLAAWFHALPEKTATRIQADFSAKGIGAAVTPRWVQGPYTGTECCIEMELTIPPRLLSKGDEPSPYWVWVYELGKPG